LEKLFLEPFNELVWFDAWLEGFKARAEFCFELLHVSHGSDERESAGVLYSHLNRAMECGSMLLWRGRVRKTLKRSCLFVPPALHVRVLVCSTFMRGG